MDIAQDALVTITAGGNDLGYAGSMTRFGVAGLLWTARFTPTRRACGA